MDTISEWLSLLIAGGLGGFVTNLLSGRREQLAVRSTFLRAFALSEDRRWASEEHTEQLHVDALREVESTALAANQRRDVVNAYLALSTTGWDESSANLETHDRAFLYSGTHEVLREMAVLVSYCAWHPIRARLFGGQKLKGVLRLAEVKLEPTQWERAKNTPWGFVLA